MSLARNEQFGWLPRLARHRAHAMLAMLSNVSAAVVLSMAIDRTALAQPAPSAPPARTVASLADSIAAAGDTTRAYALLDSALRRDKNNAAAWLQFGLLNWNMARSKRNANYIGDQRALRLLQGADTALRLATQFAPDSARYWLVLSKFNLTSGVSTMRFAATGQVSSAFDAATRTGDRQLLAVAADEVGMATWRRYEAIANRALTSDDQRVQLTSTNNWQRGKARDYINSFAKRIEPPTGAKDYANALEKFRTAFEADPTSLRISRHLFMALGEHFRWDEMRELATTRTKAYPLDYQSQLALGLALHRLNDDRHAQLAFDSALTLMEDAPRNRMTRFTRLLRPQAGNVANGIVADTAAFNKLAPDKRRGLEAMYWLMSDPLTLTAENEYQLEFLSRVTYADFRWTNEDFDLLGADTDRGDVFVRYGPPDQELNVGGTSTGGDGGTTLVWAYNNGNVFFFDLPPGFGTARYALNDRDNVDQIRNAMPVTWDNVPTSRLMDTIPVRITRFRGQGDSTNILVAARIPLDSLVRGLDFVRAPVDVDFRIYDQYVRVRGVESVQTSVRPDSTLAPQARAWTRALGPGINVVRVEALQADSKRAARAMTRIATEPTTGFGMSDILLGDAPKPIDSATGVKRWTDLAITANTGSFTSRAPIGMVWELYDLAPRDGQNRYRMAVTVERVSKGGVVGLAAQLFDGIGRSIGREQRGRDKLTISFDRTVAAANTLVEYLSLDLADSPAGEYRLRVEITDLVTQKLTSRQTEFSIR